MLGADTARIDAFAAEGVKLLNFAPEAQCTPSRSALMTGRCAIPWYDPKRDGITTVLESRKGEPVRPLQQLTLDVRRDIDAEFIARSKAFMKRSVDAGKPFFLYFNHSLMHMPTIPRTEFKGKSGQGDWADCLLELDADFAAILDTLKELGVDGNTIVVFSGDNGPEEVQSWRGHPGFFDGSYFTGMEGSLRTPCIVHYPGLVPAGMSST